MKQREEILKKVAEYLKDPIKLSTLLKSPDDPTKPLKLYDYQKEVIMADSDRKAMLFCRQAGKSTTLSVIMAHAALAKPYTSIVVITPRKNHLEALLVRNFERIIAGTVVEKFIKSIRHSDPMRYQFTNGSYIIGIVAGEDGQGVQGQRADLLILDECFTADTPVITPDGVIPISSIRPGMLVLTVTTKDDIERGDLDLSITYETNLREFNLEKNPAHTHGTLVRSLHYTPVLESSKVGKKEFILLVTETGRRIKVTPDHPFVDRDGRYVPAYQVEEVGIPVLARENFTKPKPSRPYLKRLEAAVYGVLRAGRVPKDKAEFFGALELLGIPRPELKPMMDETDGIPKDRIFKRLEKVPDWIFEDPIYAADFAAGFITPFDKIPDDEYLVRALQHYPDLCIKDGEIQESSIVYFFDNIGYRFNKEAEVQLIFLVEYLRAGATGPVDEWVLERLSGPLFFEKIVSRIPIGVFDAYTIKTRNQHYIAAGAFVHNCDYLTEKAWNKALPILNNPNAKLVLSSTPSGARNFFWQIFNDPSLGFYTKRVTAYEVPHISEEKIELFRKTFTPEDFEHEILAEFGSLESGIFNIQTVSKIFVDAEYEELQEKVPNKGLTFMGVDWNGGGIGTVIVVLRRLKGTYTFPIVYTDDSVTTKRTLRKVKNPIVVLHREIIYSSTENEFEDIQTRAVKRIVELQKKFNVNAIYADYGYGSVQLELLHQIGSQTHNDVLMYVMGIPANKTFELPDPITGEGRKKSAKSLFVSILRHHINIGTLLTSYEDDNLNPESPNYGSRQTIGYELRNYRIERWTPKGEPVYSREHDHFIAALGFAMLGYLIEFDPIFSETDKGLRIWVGPLPSVETTSRSDISLKLYENAFGSDEQEEVMLKLGLDKYKKKPTYDIIEGLPLVPDVHKIVRRKLDIQSPNRFADHQGGSRWPGKYSPRRRW